MVGGTETSCRRDLILCTYGQGQELLARKYTFLRKFRRSWSDGSTTPDALRPRVKAGTAFSGAAKTVNPVTIVTAVLTLILPHIPYSVPDQCKTPAEKQQAT